MSALLRTRLTAFGAARDGLAAMEFAFIAPIMLLLALGATDTARYVIATERVEKVAGTIGQMITENGSGNVTYLDLQFYHDSAMVIFPDVLSAAAQQNVSWNQDIAISMASVQFATTQTNCGATCAYTPKVVWTGGSNPRPCAPTLIQAASDAIVPSPTTLPPDVYGPGSIIVVDVQFNFRTLFGSYLPSIISISRSVYLAPRYVPLISYQVISGDNGIAQTCP